MFFRIGPRTNGVSLFKKSDRISISLRFIVARGRSCKTFPGLKLTQPHDEHGLLSVVYTGDVFCGLLALATLNDTTQDIQGILKGEVSLYH